MQTLKVAETLRLLDEVESGLLRLLRQYKSGQYTTLAEALNKIGLIKSVMSEIPMVQNDEEEVPNV